MSLTNELKHRGSFARMFVDREFPHLPILARTINARIAHYAHHDNPQYDTFYLYTLIGTAIDYRIRYYFAPDVHQSSTIQDAIKQLSSVYSTPEFFSKLYDHFGRGKTLTGRFNSDAEILLARLNPVARRLAPRDEEQLCRFCLLLARLDHVRRGLGPSYFYEDMRTGNFAVDAHISEAPPELVADLCTLAVRIVDGPLVAILKNSSVVHHGTTLVGSPDIGGADVDLVVDGRIIEFKTTVKPKITTEYLRQLVGYVLLDYDDNLELRYASIYLVRQDHLEGLDIEHNLMPSSRRLTDLRASFRDGLRKYNDARR